MGRGLLITVAKPPQPFIRHREAASGGCGELKLVIRKHEIATSALRASSQRRFVRSSQSHKQHIRHREIYVSKSWRSH